MMRYALYVIRFSVSVTCPPASVIRYPIPVTRYPGCIILCSLYSVRNALSTLSGTDPPCRTSTRLALWMKVKRTSKGILPKRWQSVWGRVASYPNGGKASGAKSRVTQTVTTRLGPSRETCYQESNDLEAGYVWNDRGDICLLIIYSKHAGLRTLQQACFLLVYRNSEI